MLSAGQPITLDVYKNTASVNSQITYITIAALHDDKSNLGDPEKPICGNWVADPIQAVTGNIYMLSNDIQYGGSIKYSRYYNSLNTSTKEHGYGWSGDYSQKIVFNGVWALATRPSGVTVRFKSTNGIFADELGVSRLASLSEGNWLLYSKSNTVEKYNASGKLLSIQESSGKSITLNYLTNETHVVDNFSRELILKYNANGFVFSVGDLAGNVFVQYDYDGVKSLLKSAVFPGNEVISYQYKNTNFPNTLTDIVDENNSLTDPNVSFITWSIDADGRATSSVNAGTLGLTTIGRNGEQVTLQDPLGTIRTLTYTAKKGVSRLVSTSQPAGSGCSASTQTQAFDDVGNLTLRDDFNGKRVCYSYDGQNREAARVEGLSGGASGASCPSALASTNLPSFAQEARKISTVWHPDWHLPTRRAEPGKFTTWVYNGQVDPFNGGAVASCAPANALLLDGKPIAVLCKTVEQATLDATGALGFAAALDDHNIYSRTTTATYNQYGQVLTQTDARNNPTTYEYYSDTTTTHTQGDLWKVTNAKGHVTEYTKYNPHGQVLESKDPNGVISSYTYDLRQRLKTATVAGETTAIDYWPTGLLKKVTRSDGSYLYYEYDDAHRLTDVSDNQGHKVHYTLDNAGNRTKEEVQDPSGNLTRQIDRTYDALNRLHTVTGTQQ